MSKLPNKDHLTETDICFFSNRHMFFPLRTTQMYQGTGNNDKNEWSGRKGENARGIDRLL